MNYFAGLVLLISLGLFVWEGLFLQASLRDEYKEWFYKHYPLVCLLQIIILVAAKYLFQSTIVFALGVFLLILVQARIWFAYYRHFVYYSKKHKDL